MLKKCLFSLCLLIIPAVVMAEPNGNVFNYHAYLDTSYNYLTKSNVFTSGSFNRVYDIEENGFTLQQVGLIVSYLPDQGYGGLLQLIAGRDANRTAPSGWDPYFGSQTLAFYSNNAYLQYAVSRLTFMGGLLDTLTGIEEVDASADANFSRSILDDAQPGAHIGLRSKYAMNATTDLFVGIGNGLDTVRQAGRQTMLEVGASSKPFSALYLALQTMNGNNQVLPGAVSGPLSQFFIVDLVAQYQLNSLLSLGLNGDYFAQQKGAEPDGNETGVSWEGLAGYVSYQFLERWSVAARAEIFDDANGFFTGVKQNWREGTLTLQFKPNKHLILRAETRRDLSNVDAFVNADGRGASDYQQSFAVEGIYVFA